MSDKPKKVLFIYTDWNQSEERAKVNGYGGVGYYRIIKPAEALRKLGWDAQVAGKDLIERFGDTPEKLWPAVFSEFDAVVVKQMDNPQAAAAFFFFAEKYNTPVIMDLDDDYLSVKPDQPAWKYYHPGSQKRAVFAAALSLVDALFLSTEPLQKSYRKWLAEVYGIETPSFVLPNCSRFEDWPELPERLEKKNLTIGYAGSITHNADLQMVFPAVFEVMEKYPLVDFESFGALHKETFDMLVKGQPQKLINRVKLTTGGHSWEHYPPRLTGKDWDIGICPLVDDTFTRGKSHIKWMEYTMTNIPTVASKVYPYFEPVHGVPTIEDGKTGFLASTTEEWVMLLSKLVEDHSLRREIATNAYEAIGKNWQYDQWAHRWADALNDVLCNFQTRRTKMALSKSAKTPVDSETPGSPASPSS
jgi:glycosyltransferase involved in cell wall biosynthesis